MADLHEEERDLQGEEVQEGVLEGVPEVVPQVVPEGVLEGVPEEEELSEIQIKIKTGFGAEIGNKTIFVSTDLEPDDMMALKLLSPKLAACSRIYVVIGEHATADIEQKCRLFYILAKKYGFLDKIQKEEGQTIIYKGHTSSFDKEGVVKKYPQIIFDTFNRDEDFTSLLLKDLTDQTIQEELFGYLNSQTLFLLMKPPKELFLPTEFNKDECKRCLALMYGSFNISQLKEYLEQQQIQQIVYTKSNILGKLESMFNDLCYIERKPELANFFTKPNGKFDLVDPNPFYGVLPNMKILDDNELHGLCTSAYTDLKDDFIDFCTRNWQTTILEKVKKTLKLVPMPSPLESDEERKSKKQRIAQTLIAEFKSMFFSDTESSVDFKDNPPGYYEGILDDNKLIALLTTIPQFFDDEDKKTQINSLTEPKEKAKAIAGFLLKKIENKWGMMIGMVLCNGLQTPLADQLLAVLILHPQEFNIKKVARDGVQLYTMLDHSEEVETITDIAQLENPVYNNYKLALYKKALTKISESARNIPLVPQGGYKIRKSKKVNIHKRIKTRRKNRRKKTSKRRISRRKKAQAKNKKRKDYTKKI
jgi:hypothetical protein